MGKQWKQLEIFLLVSKITADGDCSHEIKRHLFLGRKAMTNLCVCYLLSYVQLFATPLTAAYQAPLSMLSRLVITFLPRNKHLLISWLQSPSAVIFEPKKINSLFPLFSHLFAMKWWDWMLWSSFFECWVLNQFFHSPLTLSSRGSLVLRLLT